MTEDDLVRSLDGVVVSLRDMENGNSRLFFDDVSSEAEIRDKDWKYRSFYTFSNEYENTALAAMTISEKQLADIGAALVARLAALRKHPL